MQSIIAKYAFPCPPSSYTNDLPYLEFITRTTSTCSSFSDSVTEFRIPIRYYHRSSDSLTMIICHGNGEDIGEMDLKEVSDSYGVNTYLFDGSQSEPRELRFPGRIWTFFGNRAGLLFGTYIMSKR